LLLTLAVISLPISLLSGYFTGSEYRRPPVGFQSHWIAAVVTSILATALLLWRLVARDRLPRPARIGAMSMLIGSALAVSYTGFLGGQMVFGGRTPQTDMADSVQPTPSTTVVAVDAGTKELGSAAGKIENAATKLDAATQKLAASTQAAPAPVAPTTAPATSPELDAKIAEMNRTAEKLDRAAARFEQSAQRLEELAARMPSTSPQVAAAPSAAQSTSRPTVAAKPTAKPAGQSTLAARPTAVPAKPSAPAFDVQLVAAGEKVLRNEDNDCLSCHSFNGEGRGKNGDLTFVGRKWPDVEWHIAHLKDPASKVPGSKMPAYDDMSLQDLRALSTFLVSRR
jgi:cytochrome c2